MRHYATFFYSLGFVMLQLANSLKGRQMLHQSLQNFTKFLLVIFSLAVLQACTKAGDSEEEDPSLSLTASYSVRYLSDLSSISEGKSTFSFSISDRDTDAPLSGLTVAVMPMMDMVTGHMHDAPVTPVTDNGDGTYTVTVYYLMPSAMMDGSVMGEWELQIMIGGMAGETAHFHPDVMMAMGDSVKVALLGQSDLIMGMMAPESRRYFIFKNSVMGTTGDHSFSFFIAARESMMSHVAVYENVTLNQGDMTYEYQVSPITVEVSTDGSSWTSATSSGDGNYMVSGLTGLTDNVQGEIYVRLTIQGEQKTTNGSAPAGDGSNDYAVFTVTPGATMSM